MSSNAEQISEFSLAVRNSTVKRLLKVPRGRENWQISPIAMSYADIAQHLLDTDEWLINKIEMKALKPIKGKAGSVKINNTAEFEELIKNLQFSGGKRAKFIRNLGDSDLQEKIFDERFGNEVSVWWIIMRGNLDHEIHHRGQISAYLKTMEIHP